MFNTSSDEQYSLTSEELGAIDSLNYEIRLKKEEIANFINLSAKVTVYGGGIIIGVITGFDKSKTQNQHWVVMEHCLIDGETCDFTKVELGDVMSIEEEKPSKETNDRGRNPGRYVYDERARRSSSGYISRAISRSERSTSETTSSSEPLPVRPRSEQARSRGPSGGSTGSNASGASYAEALKGSSPRKEDELVLELTTLKESSFPPLAFKEEENFQGGGSRPKTPAKTSSSRSNRNTPSPRPRTPAARPKTPASKSTPTTPVKQQLCNEKVEITVTSAEGITKIYPSLPSMEQVNRPEFIVNEPISHHRLAPPPPSSLPNWTSHGQMKNSNEEKEKKTYTPISEEVRGKVKSVLEKYEKINHPPLSECFTGKEKEELEKFEKKTDKKAELLSIFIKFAQRRLKKESEEAKEEKREPDFHYALMRACDLCNISVEQSEFRNIKIRPATNLAHEDVLEGFFQAILLMPNTLIPSEYQTDIFEDFVKERPTLMLKDRKTGQLFYPVRYTEEGNVDELYMKAHWRKLAPEMKFMSWLREYDIQTFLEKNMIVMKSPLLFTNIFNEGYRNQLRSNWEQMFRQTGIQFEKWLPTVVNMPRSKKQSSSASSSSSSGVNEEYTSTTNSPSPDEKEDRSKTPIEIDNRPDSPDQEEEEVEEEIILSKPEEKSENQPKPAFDQQLVMEETLKAFKLLTDVKEQDKVEMHENFKIWSGQAINSSFQEFLDQQRAEKKRKEDEEKSSGEFSLASQLRRLAINAESNPASYDDSGPSSASSSITYNDSGLEDIINKTPEEWSNFHKRMFLMLPHTSNEELTQSVLIEANMKEPINQEMLQSIRKEDFLTGGRFAFIHIPKYVYIPPEIAQALNFTYVRLHNHYCIVWRRLLCARMEALAIVENDINTWLTPAYQIMEDCPWVKMLWDTSVTKTFPFDYIDILQMAEAYKSVEGSKLHIVKNRQVYDRLFRPLERLFALNMPLRDRLFYGMEECDATDDVTAIMMSLIGITKVPLNLSPRFVVEELSRIRHMQVGDFAIRSGMDVPPQLVNQVNLKESHHRRYKSVSKRTENQRTLRMLIGDSITDGIFNDEMLENFDLLSDAINGCNEELEVIRLQIQENFDLLARTTSESHKKECLYNIDVLRRRQVTTEKNYQRQWKAYEDLLHKRAKTRTDPSKIGPTDLDMVSNSKSLLTDYLIDWKDRRSELSKEKVGVSLCLSKVQPSKKHTPTAADVNYRKILLTRQVEIECNIEELNDKIEKGEARLVELKKDCLPAGDEWCDDDDFWDTTVHPKKYVSPPTIQEKQKKMIMPDQLPKPALKSGANHVYVAQPGSHQSSHRNQRHSERSGIRFKPEQNRRPASPAAPVDRWSEARTVNRPRAAAERRRIHQKWLPVPYSHLPDTVMIWDGKNHKQAPYWANKKCSVVEAVNSTNYTTKSDVDQTEDLYLTKTTLANGVNFDTRLEIKMGLEAGTQFPDVVIIHETSTDKMTGLKRHDTVPFPARLLGSVMLAMQDLLLMELPPMVDDKLLTEMSLWSTDFTEFEGSHVTFKLQLQIVHIHGMSGTERMVRLKHIDLSENIIQFPWLQLPRIHRLWWNFYEDAKTQWQTGQMEQTRWSEGFIAN